VAYLGFSLYPFHLKNGPDCSLDDFCDMVADTADLMGIDHIGIGTDLCQEQPLSVLEWMRNGRWSKEMDYGEGSKANADWPVLYLGFVIAVTFQISLKDYKSVALGRKISPKSWA